MTGAGNAGRGSRREPSARLLAARVVSRVIDETAYSDRALRAALDESELSTRDRGFCTLLVYGTLTYLRPIDAALDSLVRDGLDSLPPEARNVLRVAAFELHPEGPRTPDFAAVDRAVETVRAVGAGHLAGLANAVLRRLARDGTRWFVAPDDAHETAEIAHRESVPDWLAASLVERIGTDRTERVLECFNAPVPVHLRIRDPATRSAVLDDLRQAGGNGEPHPHCDSAVILAGADPAKLDVVRERRAVIQDASSQVVAALLPRAGDGAPAKILDACAGTGGKTLHLIDRFAQASVVATDRSRAKLRQLEERLREHGVSDERFATARWDLRHAPPTALAERAPFDAVIVDAPCTALGTIGRHPEVRWTRDASTAATMGALQAELLRATARLVSSGGWLIYAVCTWTAEETWGPVRTLLSERGDFEVVPAAMPPVVEDVAHDGLVDESGGLALWPDQYPGEGFFAVRLRRQ